MPITYANHIRNIFIRDSLGVSDVADKLQERRLTWFGHVTCRSKNYVGCKCLTISVPGVRSLERLRKRWLDVVIQDINANGLTTEYAKNHAKWSG